jgi:aminoglycoside 2'-N-acetyltransferase I
MSAASGPGIRRLRSDELSSEQIAELKELMLAAFAEDEHGGFTDEDWQHAIGGVHFLLEVDRAIASHASVVARDLHVAGRPLRTGYVEAVATAPQLHGRGYGSAVMHAVNAHVAAHFELGALGTGSQGFYERLGWEIWRGPTSVRTVHGEARTPDEDGYILVLRTPSTPPLDLTSPISCEWRLGDVW